MSGSSFSSLSRRQVLAGAAGAGLVLGGGLIMPSRAFAQETPKKGGNLRIGIAGGSTTDSLDPSSYTDSVMIFIGHGLFNALVEWAQDGRPVPELAESWETRGSAATWVFNLRKDVTFSNGKPFTADDAIYSLNMHRSVNGKETTSGAAGPMKVVTDVKKLGDHQIEITLDSPDADFPYVLTDYHILMVPEGHTDWSKPIGTAGYVLESFDPGVSCTMTRRDGYWKQGRAHVDRIEVTVINDGPARVSALVTGQVDYVNRLDPNAVAQVEGMGKFSIIRAPGGWHTVIAARTDTAPFNNNDIRMALKHAIDRQQILQTLFNGYGTVGNDHPIPASDPYFNSELPQTPFDPDKAAFHFKKAGIADAKMVLQVSEATFNGAIDMGTLYQQTAQKAGIPLEVKQVPADGFWSDVWLKGEFVASYWGGRAAATAMLAVAYKADAPWNETKWNNEAFEKLLADARSETDEAKRKGYIWEMQAMLNREGGAVVPAFRDWIDGTTSAIKGVGPHGGFDMCNGYAAEKAWIDA